MADYTTLTKVKLQLEIQDVTGTLNDDTLINDYITQASKFIDDYCRRTFSESVGTLNLDVGAPYTYGSKLFFGQDVLGVVSVVNGNGSTLTASDYVLLPANETPKYGMQLKNGAYWTYSDSPLQAITVVATLGYCTEATRPADITLAATKLSAFLYQNRSNFAPQIMVADGTINVPAEAQAMIMRILDKGRYIKDELYV